MAKKPIKTKLRRRDLLGFLLDMAERHGRESEPDMEIGDLQHYFYVCWDKLTKKQQEEVAIEIISDGDYGMWMQPDEVRIGKVTIKKPED